MKMPELKYDEKVDYQRGKDRIRERTVKSDIAKIDEAISSTDESAQLQLHKNLDGKYQFCISGWGQSLYGFNKEYGFNYNYLGADSIKENLAVMRAKLESFALGWNEKGGNFQARHKAPDVSVTVNNTVNISVSFQEARQKIEDMTALSQAQTDEILEKIDELERIQAENSSRKSKWEKVKPILSFVLDKGADVAVAILTLIVQMKLGA